MKPAREDGSAALLAAGARPDYQELRPSPWDMAAELRFEPSILKRLEECIHNPDPPSREDASKPGKG